MKLLDIIAEAFDDYKQSAPRSKSISKIHKSLNPSAAGGKFGDLTKNDMKLLKWKEEEKAKEERAKELLALKQMGHQQRMDILGGELATKPEGEYYIDPDTYKIKKHNAQTRAAEYLKNVPMPDDKEGREMYFENYLKILLKYVEGGSNRKFNDAYSSGRNILAFIFGYNIPKTINYMKERGLL